MGDHYYGPERPCNCSSHEGKYCPFCGKEKNYRYGDRSSSIDGCHCHHAVNEDVEKRFCGSCGKLLHK
jgi:hypothetical protein